MGVKHGLILREEHKLRVCENRVLRIIFGPKRDGMTGGWRKLHNEQLHNVYSSPSIIRSYQVLVDVDVGAACGENGGEDVYRLLVGMPQGRRPPGKPRRGWINNIKMDLVEMELGSLDWTGREQDR
jgi:hypothetical protein